MRLVLVCIFSVMMLSRFGEVHQSDLTSGLWLIRSQSITADLIKDSADLTPHERALVWARLAERWWRDDPARARSWILKGIETVEVVPNAENNSERQERRQIARMLLQIVTPLDQKLSKRLSSIMTDGLERC